MCEPQTEPRGPDGLARSFEARFEGQLAHRSGARMGKRCEHGRQRSRCTDCWRAGNGGASFCSHGRCRYACKVCGGGSFCPHRRQRYSCKECGGREAAQARAQARAEARAEEAHAKAARRKLHFAVNCVLPLLAASHRPGEPSVAAPPTHSRSCARARRSRIFLATVCDELGGGAPARRSFHPLSHPSLVEIPRHP